MELLIPNVAPKLVSVVTLEKLPKLIGANSLYQNFADVFADIKNLQLHTQKDVKEEYQFTKFEGIVLSEWNLIEKIATAFKCVNSIEFIDKYLKWLQSSSINKQYLEAHWQDILTPEKIRAVMLPDFYKICLEVLDEFYYGPNLEQIVGKLEQRLREAFTTATGLKYPD